MAHKTQAELQADIITALVDNNVGAVTVAILRQLVQDITESVDVREGALADKLDKVTLDAQTVAGPVEFLMDITVPSASVILGADGARISSAGRAFAFTDARERNTLFAQYSYDNTGGTKLSYWEIAARITANVCPDFAATLDDPQDLAFSGAIGNTLTRAFQIRPKTSGTVMSIRNSTGPATV